MVAKNGPIIASKEDVNFKEALKLYDGKQYKKALKLVDSTLKKNSNHAESLALKGCIFHFSGNKEEAEAYILKGIAKGPSNYLVNHLAGIYYRALDNYEEAVKWFRATVENGSPNKHLLRDLANMQVQVRDYKNLKDSRQAYLEFQPGYRANWTGLAVALHLNKNYSSAISTLSKIEDIIKNHLQEADRYEQSECVLYKNSIMAENGDIEGALATLTKDDDEIRDRLSVLEYRAQYLCLLGRKLEAALEYRKLLQRNPDNASYYKKLELSLGIEEANFDQRVKLYAKLAKFYPRSDPPKYLPLTFLPASHPKFLTQAEEYILPQLKRGVPATFVNVKPLYKDYQKLKVIEGIVSSFYDTEVPKLNPTVDVWTKYFLSQHYLYLNDLSKATEYIDAALVHSPTLVELYILKARVLKHYGKIEEAAEKMDEGRALDLQDRFVNSKATKYLLRANRVDEAINRISLFTKLDEDAVNGCKDLHLMQVNWVLLENAEAYTRLYHEYEQKLKQLDISEETESALELENELVESIEIYKGLAVKRYQGLLQVFKIFHDDQFDFHSYCMRRGTPRDYVDTLKWEDNLCATPIYIRIVQGIFQLYLELYEQQAKEDDDDVTDADLKFKTKKNNKKQKKAKAQSIKKREELIAKVESVKNDKDPLGSHALAELRKKGNKILDVLIDLVKPLTEQVKCNKITWELAYQIYMKQGKYVLALQSVRNLDNLVKSEGGNSQEIEAMVARLLKACQDPTTNPAIAKVVEKGLATVSI